MRVLRLFFSTILSLFASLSAYSSETIVYSVTDVSWEPYWIITGKKTSGILNDVMKELDVRLPHTLLASNPLPVKRSRLTFNMGGVIIECCVSPEWREVEGSGGEMLWSEVVMTTEEVIVFPVGRSFHVANTDDLRGKTIATVLGYGYAGDDKFIRSDSTNNISQLGMVAKGRADAAIIDRTELNFMLEREPQVQALAHKIELGPVIGQSSLRMRVHSSRPDLLPHINHAIERMKSDGTIADIIRRYIN